MPGDEPGEDAPWQPDDVRIVTVGIDIGSTTSHLQFSRLRLQRGTRFSSRYEVAEREILFRSEVIRTPVTPDGLIAGEDLGAFIEQAYAGAGLARDEVDTGAVILTGTALGRANSAAIAALFAREGGRFVCATAGHHLEAVLAAHGSGAVRASRLRGDLALHIDIGGGTTKLALIERGRIRSVSALAAGARVPLAAEFMADAIVAAARGEFVSGAAWLLPPLAIPAQIDAITFSGGVGELFYGRTHGDFGDAGPALAGALRRREGQLPGPVLLPDEAIRATVAGASQFSVELSGSTISVPDPGMLPLRDVPVARAADASAGSLRGAALRSPGEGALALSMPWSGEPTHRAIRSLAEACIGATARRPLVVALDADVARSVGQVLSELGERGIVVLDGLDLADLEYVDIGRPLPPAGSVPVVVKTLLL